MSKYNLLTDWLGTQKGTEINLGFDQVEQILRFNLPKSARTYREWWANSKSGHVQSRGWLGANWEVDAVDLERRRVKFLKMAGRPDHLSVHYMLPVHDEGQTDIIGIHEDITGPSVSDKFQTVTLNLTGLSQKSRSWLKEQVSDDNNLSSVILQAIERHANRMQRLAIIAKYEAAAIGSGSDSLELIKEARDER
jgi:hypothetical protein